MQTPSCCWPSWLFTVFGAKGRSAAALLPAPSPALRPLLIEPSACSIDLDPTTRALSECGGFGRLVSTVRNYSLSDALESLDHDGNDLALLAGAGANAAIHLHGGCGAATLWTCEGSRFRGRAARRKLDVFRDQLAIF